MKLLEEKLNTAVSLQSILFATDFSQASEAALPFVAAMSLRYGGMVHVAHVLPEFNVVRPSAIDPAIIGSIYEDADSDTQEKMQQLSLRFEGFPHHTYIRHGKVGKVLSDIIRERKVDLLVAGTHGRTGVSKLVLGSVAEEIFRTATCPVLTVGPKVPRLTKTRPRRSTGDVEPVSIEFRRILYATDFTSQSLAAASYAFSLAREFRSALILLHVIEEYGNHPHLRPGPIDAALRMLEDLQREAPDLRRTPTSMVEFGSPADRILQIATEQDADLVVLGVRPSRIEAAIHRLWGTAYKVVALANCPVLTVRQ